MITENIKRFAVVLNCLDQNTKKHLIEELKSFSNYLDCGNTKDVDSIEFHDINIIYAFNLFRKMYGRDYYFPRKSETIIKSQMEDKERMLIVVHGIDDFYKASSKERKEIINKLSVAKQPTCIKRVIRFFKKAREI